MRSERDKMLAGERYDPADPELVTARCRARGLCQALNEARGRPREWADLLHQLFGQAGEGLEIEPPFACDYGSNIFFGRRAFLNYNCIILDVAAVRIGEDARLGPAVQIYTALHPMAAAERRVGVEFAKPVSIGADVWIGGAAIICPGVKVGPRSVIGAGSVVTRDVPADVFAAGNPCRVIRPLTE